MQTARVFAFSLDRLRTDLGDRVIGADDPGYDEARPSSTAGRPPAGGHRPCRGCCRRRLVVDLARDSGLELAVRSGGHSVAGHSVSEGGIVLDLSDMQALEIDVEGRTAWAETGLTAGEITTAARGRTAWRPGSATPARSGSAGSRSAAGSATSSASTASRSTPCWPPTS